jgi:DNA repair exonuclease SbcCD nuclease subunit
MSNLKEVRRFIPLCLEYAEKRKWKAIVVLGDILHDHERLHTTALNIAGSFLNNLSQIAPTYVLVGNHDLINNSQFLTSNHWMNGLKLNQNITVVDKVESCTIDGKKIILVPYVQPGRFVEALETKYQREEWKKADIIFAHQEFRGCKMGSMVSEEGDKWEEEWPFVVSGHIHRNQTPQCNVYYPGSALQVAFGESEKNVLAVVDCKNMGRENIEEVDLGLPRKKIIYTDPEGVKELNMSKYTNHQLKICVDSSKDDFKALKKSAQYKKLEKKGVKIVYKRKRAAITRENIQTAKSIDQQGTTPFSFSQILNEVVIKKNSTTLHNAYKKIKISL